MATLDPGSIAPEPKGVRELTKMFEAKSKEMEQKPKIIDRKGIEPKSQFAKTRNITENPPVRSSLRGKRVDIPKTFEGLKDLSGKEKPMAHMVKKYEFTPQPGAKKLGGQPAKTTTSKTGNVGLPKIISKPNKTDNKLFTGFKAMIQDKEKYTNDRLDVEIKKTGEEIGQLEAKIKENKELEDLAKEMDVPSSSTSASKFLAQHQLSTLKFKKGALQQEKTEPPNTRSKTKNRRNSSKKNYKA